MEATISINADELDNNFVENIKRMFLHHELHISVQPIDKTDYILSRPGYADELLRRIEEYEQTKKTIIIDPSTLL